MPINLLFLLDGVGSHQLKVQLHSCRKLEAETQGRGLELNFVFGSQTSNTPIQVGKDPCDRLGWLFKILQSMLVISMPVVPGLVCRMRLYIHIILHVSSVRLVSSSSSRILWGTLRRGNPPLNLHLLLWLHAFECGNFTSVSDDPLAAVRILWRLLLQLP